MPEKFADPSPFGDFVLPFDLPKLGVRGRLVRLDSASGRALSAHVLPEEAARVTGEMVALGAILGSALKLDGRLTIQTKGDGPLDLVAADYYGAEADKARGVRGFARLDVERFDELDRKGFADLAGKGALAITIEPRRGGKTYQGIVELSEDGIAASAETYFAQSEQLPTSIRLAAAALYLPGDPAPHWRAGGMMLQMTPNEATRESEEGELSDDWERLSLILGTVEDLELVDTTLAPETLLWRLFHEDEVRVEAGGPVSRGCRCSVEYFAGVLAKFPEAERDDMADEAGLINVDCAFCSRVFPIALDEIAAKY